jgi:UDP-N-acetyl-D-mannosaminuronic acid dehydrogenase
VGVSQTNAPQVCIVGGAGHVGLPLALAFASHGDQVLLYDINSTALDRIAQGSMPFMERGAPELLLECLKLGRLAFSSDVADISGVPSVIITIGTPIDEFMNPTFKGMRGCFDALAPYLDDDQLLVLRSTVYPGTTSWLEQHLGDRGVRPKIAFCPERIVQGYALEELRELPQIVSGVTPDAEDRAADLFGRIAPSVVRLQPGEAELVKLFSNAYRYIQFAAANQFFMIANSIGVDYYRVLYGMRHEYPRMGDMPRAGFAAGPCLFKDTMQLTAFFDNQFSLGYTAMLINEGLPIHVVDQLAIRYDLAHMTIGILGMAFKAESDDPRSSLSYKLKKLLQFRARDVLCTDPYVTNDSELIPLSEVVDRSDLLIIAAPHKCYNLLRDDEKPIVDIWNFLGRGALF